MFCFLGGWVGHLLLFVISLCDNACDSFIVSFVFLFSSFHCFLDLIESQMQSQKTEGRNGELLPVKIPYNRNEIRRRIESGIPPATAEEYLLRVRYEWKKKKTLAERRRKTTN